MMPLVWGFWIDDHTWERLGKFTNAIPSLSSFSIFKVCAVVITCCSAVAELEL